MTATASASAAKIPVIDISAPGADEAQVARELVDAAVEHGFVYIKNTGRDIPVEAVDNAFQLSKKLFALPVEEKEPCKIGLTNRGWAGMHVETLDPKNQRMGDLKEAFNFAEFANGKAQQPLPTALEPHQPQIGAFFDLCYELSLRLNGLLGLGLGVDPPDFFRRAHLRELGSSGNTLRMLYYPPLDRLHSESGQVAEGAGREDVRAGAHSDYGSLTLLFRLKGQAGLEIQTPDGGWAPVPVCPPGTEDDPAPPILVNIGDLLSYWTNGLLRSTVHRVVFPDAAAAAAAGESDAEPRYSIAFFVHPVGTSALTAVPSERVMSYNSATAGAEKEAAAAAAAKNPYAERKVMTADEHLQMRLRASYLQIYHDEDKEAATA